MTDSYALVIPDAHRHGAGHRWHLSADGGATTLCQIDHSAHGVVAAPDWLGLTAGDLAHCRAQLSATWTGRKLCRNCEILAEKEHPDRAFGLLCGECGAPMQPIRTKYGPAWGCTRYPECAGIHGAHPDGRPLGVPANKATKAARIECHEFFDRLWKGKGARMKRAQAYAWLRHYAPKPHIGEMSITDCRITIALVLALR